MTLALHPDRLDHLRALLGPSWGEFLDRLRADLRSQRSILADTPDSAAIRAAAHVVTALAATAGAETLAEAARAQFEGRGTADPRALPPMIDALLDRLDAIAAEAPT